MSDTALATTNGETASLLNIIARASRDSSVDVTKLQALLDMQERVVNHQARHEYNQAMAAVAFEMEPIKRDAPNPQFGKKYATLSQIEAAIRPIYAKHGFSVRFGTGAAEPGHVYITCTVAHSGGHSERLGLTAPMDLQTGAKARTPVQAVGSTVSYLRRYLLSMAFNITFQDDDDGEGTRKPAGTREAINQEVPLNTERKQTASEWLDQLEGNLMAVENMQEYDAIDLSPRVTRAKKELHGAALSKLWQMLNEHRQRLLMPPGGENEILGEEGIET